MEKKSKCILCESETFWCVAIGIVSCGQFFGAHLTFGSLDGSLFSITLFIEGQCGSVLWRCFGYVA